MKNFSQSNRHVALLSENALYYINKAINGNRPVYVLEKIASWIVTVLFVDLIIYINIWISTYLYILTV